MFQSPEPKSVPESALGTAPITSSDDAARERELRFLADKVRRDPEDFSANKKFAGFYLQPLRETGNVEVRKDIYGADALGWTALIANKISEAQIAIKEAWRLGTIDAKLFYHAALIARAAGNESSARDFLQRGLKLNPQFDPLQSALAKALPKSR